ncbi:hypothetical protein [Mycobacterium sp. SMC-15]|uniref:hypothetical protein n=1 Tax=Mycobacterium sp. SMC-15 TaxID=3381627 RepID=UPI0038771657
MTPISTSKAAHSTARTPGGLAERPVGVSCGLVDGGTPHWPLGARCGGTGGDGGVGSSGVGEVVIPTALTIYGEVKQLVGADGIEPPTAGV